jgi:hypothetical protein
LAIWRLKCFYETFVQGSTLGILLNICAINPPHRQAANRYQQGEENDNDTENDRENGLRMKNEMTMKEKRFSFFADTQERKAESRSTFGTLPFARHISQRFAKVKEPNLPYLIFLITK